MSTALSLLNGQNIPDHVKKYMEKHGNIADRATVPSVTYGGKRWTISLNGEKIPMQKKDDDGDLVPISITRWVILDYAKRRGRAYYEGLYDPDKPGKPLCSSEDGIKSDQHVDEMKELNPSWTGKCENCPLAAKGSKVVDGKEMVACSQHRMLALLPANKLDFEPLRLKIAITSDWDGKNAKNESQGWFSFSQYIDYLRKNGVTDTAVLVTKMKFDGDTDYPKLLFTNSDWLTQAQTDVVEPIANSDKVKKLLSNKWTAAGTDGVEKGTPDEEREHDDAEAIAAAAVEAKKAAAQAVVAKAAAEAKAEAEAAAAAKKAKADAKAAKKAKEEAEAAAAAKAAEASKTTAMVIEDDDEEDDSGEVELPGTVNAAAEKAKDVSPKPTTSSGELPAAVADLLSEGW
jgi:hypothetical protein